MVLQRHEAEKQRQLELLKREYEERFGKPVKSFWAQTHVMLQYPGEERRKEEEDITKKSGKDQVTEFFNPR